MVTEELWVVEYKEPGSDTWHTLDGNDSPLFFREEAELPNGVLQRILNDQRIVSPGKCEFRWTTRRLAKR